MANRQTYPSSLFPLRGDVSAEAGATSVIVQGILGFPIQDAYLPPADFSTILFDSPNSQFVFGVPWDIPVGQVLEFEGYGYSPVGISWLAPDTIAIGDGTQGDVSGAAAMTALILFGSPTYDYGYDASYTTIYSGATSPWNLILPTNPGTSGQVLTTNGTGITSWTSVASILNTSLKTAQASALSAVSLVASTPAVGMWRISFVATTTTAGSTGAILGGTTGFQITFVNGNGDTVTKTTSFSSPQVGVSTSTADTISGDQYCYAGATTAITYSFGYTAGSITPGAYDIAVYAEFLG